MLTSLDVVDVDVGIGDGDRQTESHTEDESLAPSVALVPSVFRRSSASRSLTHWLRFRIHLGGFFLRSFLRLSLN